MSIIYQPRRKGKTSPPPPPIGTHVDGRPILMGKVGRRVGDDFLLFIRCPICGATNTHGWALTDPPNVPQHKGDDCGCHPRGYRVLPMADLSLVGGRK